MPNRDAAKSKCILLVSNSRDFATDYVVAELRAREVRYLRLDLDLLAEDAISLDPIGPTLQAQTPQGHFLLAGADVAGIFFRAPTHLSESAGERYTPEEQLARHQWAALARALTVFDDAAWVNHSVATYAAESKPFQLRTAARLGWDVPPTRITNAVPPDDWPPQDASIAIKALDTFFLRLANQDAFFYTQSLARSDLEDATLRAMPVILQSYLTDKLDLRVTVVRERCFAAAVVRDGVGVDGDWRLLKDAVDYQEYNLPSEISERCIATVRALGLVFGAVDLAFAAGRYYFLEVNPTGEWAWLTERLGFPIPTLLVNELCSRLDMQAAT